MWVNVCECTCERVCARIVWVCMRMCVCVLMLTLKSSYDKIYLISNWKIARYCFCRVHVYYIFTISDVTVASKLLSDCEVLKLETSKSRLPSCRKSVTHAHTNARAHKHSKKRNVFSMIHNNTSKLEQCLHFSRDYVFPFILFLFSRDILNSRR